jgi:integrase
MTQPTQATLKAWLKKPGRHGLGRGLFFRVLPGDKAYWVYRYRVKVGGESNEREMSLGPYPELLLPEARAKHAALWAKVKSAKADPLAEKRAARTLAPAPTGTPTFGEMADDYIKTHEGEWDSAKHREQWRISLTEHCAAIRSTPIDEIGTDAVLKVLQPIWTTKAETANRLRGRIERVLNAARVDGWIDPDRANPARWKGWLSEKLANPAKIGRRGHNAAMPYAEVPAFMAKLKEIDSVATRALQFVILTASRTDEVREAPWDGEFHLEPDRRFLGPTWVIPKKRMKMDEEHRVPLSDAAVEILRGQREMRGKNPFVFPSPMGQGSKIHRSGPHAPLSHVTLLKLMRRLGHREFTVHGFRSAFNDWATEVAKADFATIQKCLAHKVGNKSSQAYDRSDRLELRRPLMTRWASYCFPVEAKVIDYATRRKRR